MKPAPWCYRLIFGVYVGDLWAALIFAQALYAMGGFLMVRDLIRWANS